MLCLLFIFCILPLECKLHVAGMFDFVYIDTTKVPRIVAHIRGQKLVVELDWMLIVNTEIQQL